MIKKNPKIIISQTCVQFFYADDVEMLRKKITMTKYRSQILLTFSFLNTCGTIKIPLEFLLWPLYLYVEDTSSRNNYLKELYFQKKYKEKKRILYQLIYDHSFKSLAKL